MYLERRSLRTRNIRKYWDEEKKRGQKHSESILEGVPKALPSLLRAQASKKAARVGFDWKKTEDVFEKMEEELKEFKKALKNKKQTGDRG